ncbi:Mitotic spindle-associated MMXD complex subunit MIP18 [Chytriomyces hyalinus]|nr:Mitotic spindle-associated MMXD complex subunit MIP18 [Chytriomyces hyalinus]
MGLDNVNPTVYSVPKDAYGQSARSRLWRMSQNSDLSDAETETQEQTEAIDAEEVFEQLHVAQLRHITVDHENSRISVVFTPTIPHCSMATLIGLCIRVQLLRCLPARFKVDINVEEGTHQSEKSVNKQLNDKERVAAAMENSHLVEVVNQCLATTIDKIAAY